MYLKSLPWASISVGFWLSVPVAAQVSEKAFELSPLQQQVVKAHDKWVVPADKRAKTEQHYIRLKMLTFNRKTDVKKQIEAYENENRRGFDPGPFYVRDATGKTADESGWQMWYREIFTIEQDWADGLKVPYFCEVLRLRDQQGQPVSSTSLNSDEYRKLSQRAVRSILQPLSAAQAEEISRVPIYVVSYIGNFEGNAKYVKLYVGKCDTAEFVVIDVSVYDHF
jgi:hypothetical protein